MSVYERGSDELDEYAAEAGTTTLYGCVACTSLVATTAETEVWSHVLSAHSKACLPADDDIWAVRCPITAEAE